MKKKRFKMNDKKKNKILNNNIDYFEENSTLDDLYQDFDITIDDEEDETEYEKILKIDVESEDLDEDLDEELEEDLEKTKRKSKKSPNATVDKEKFYVDPKEFDEQIMVYYNTNVMSDKLAEMISKISNKLSYASNFINYSYREEMVGDGIIRMMKALISKKYNRAKGTNPFSYFTRIAFNAFRNRIKKEKHMHETHEKYQREYFLMAQNCNNYVKNKGNRIIKEKNSL